MYANLGLWRVLDRQPLKTGDSLPGLRFPAYVSRGLEPKGLNQNHRRIVIFNKEALMALADKTLTCAECGKSFVFTTGEQEFYQSKGLQNEPKRCPECRVNRKQSHGHNSGQPRQMYHATCARCGCDCEVPFEPKQERPVYCSSCYEASKPAR